MSLYRPNMGSAPSFIACPDEDGSFPAIIFYMDAPGFREEICNMARRIAKSGYYCIVPDMYYRLGTVRFNLPRRDDSMTTVIKAAMNHLSHAGVNEDTDAWIQYLDAQPEVDEGPMGCVGHCMSGRHITNAATRHPHRIKAAAAFYGVGIVIDADDLTPPLFRSSESRILLQLWRERSDGARRSYSCSGKSTQESKT